MDNKFKKPKILKKKIIAKSKLFSIESVYLKFSNGIYRSYERINPMHQEGVIIIPIINNYLLCVREYNLGIENYDLGFPKGSINNNETIIEAANRELKEEIGFGANTFTPLYKLSTVPSYFSSITHIIVAQDLYQETSKKGDEPELLTIIRYPINNMMSLLDQPDFYESRNISALFLTHAWLQKSKSKKKISN